MDPNGLAEAIDKGLTFLPQKVIENKELAWNAHAIFKGVWLKHLIKGENTDHQFSYHLVKVAAGCEIGEHVHEIACELHTVIAGVGRFVLDETAIDYYPGILAVIPKGLKHRVIAGDADLYLLAKFVPALL